MSNVKSMRTGAFWFVLVDVDADMVPAGDSDASDKRKLENEEI